MFYTLSDMMLEILNKLSHKTLIRLCTVSRQWFDMISNPQHPNSCYSLRLKSSPTLTLLGFFYYNRIMHVGQRYNLTWLLLINNSSSSMRSNIGITGPCNTLPVLPIDVRTLTIDASSNNTMLMSYVKEICPTLSCNY